MNTQASPAPSTSARDSRAHLPLVNGYGAHRIVTLDGKFTYEQPTAYEIRKTARGGWWGICTYADGNVLKEFRKQPVRIIRLEGAK